MEINRKESMFRLSVSDVGALGPRLHFHADYQSPTSAAKGALYLAASDPMDPAADVVTDANRDVYRGIGYACLSAKQSGETQYVPLPDNSAATKRAIRVEYV